MYMYIYERERKRKRERDGEINYRKEDCQGYRRVVVNCPPLIACDVSQHEIRKGLPDLVPQYR